MKKVLLGVLAGILLSSATIAFATVVPPIDFKDVHQNDWYYDYINDLVQWGYADGYSDGTFRPNSPITRAETAKLIMGVYSRISGDSAMILNQEKRIKMLEAKVGTLSFPGQCFYNNVWYSTGNKVPQDRVDEGGDTYGPGSCVCKADGTLEKCAIEFN